MDNKHPYKNENEPKENPDELRKPSVQSVINAIDVIRAILSGETQSWSLSDRLNVWNALDEVYALSGYLVEEKIEGRE